MISLYRRTVGRASATRRPATLQAGGRSGKVVRGATMMYIRRLSLASLCLAAMAIAGMSVSRAGPAPTAAPPVRGSANNAAGSAPAQSPPATTQPVYKWQNTDASVALLSGGKPVWQFNYARDNGYPYFDPVNLLDGTELVWLSPPDHVHHRALWFAWKMLNGLNYWEHVPEGGVTEVTDAKITTKPDFSARIELALSYHPKDRPPVLTEKRVIIVSTPTPAGYTIDWSATFTAGQADVELRGGTAGGGYAGLSVRIAKNSSDWLFLNSEGRRVDKPSSEGFPEGIHGQRARWTDFSFVSTATRSPAGIAVFDHPSNLRYPSQWHDCMFWDSRFAYFSPAPLWSEPYTLPAGKELPLRYRILIHAGRPDPARMEQQFRAFSGQAQRDR